MRPQPLIAVTDVDASSRWYQQLLGCQSAHGGADWERLVSNGVPILQLHHFAVDHHDGLIGTAEDKPYGNGVLLWFEVDDSDYWLLTCGRRGIRYSDIRAHGRVGTLVEIAIMSFQRVDSLKSRTFIGLLIAQFLAAFNDQAIHASAMFFAIHHKTLTEANAISLMPILFYAPWAIFCTVAGWLADRYSKRQALVFWKIAEVAITGIALLGFWLGTQQGGDVGRWAWLGPWLVLSTVFLMGTHSAFFVPAKYGAMPEILPPHLLSKGNGLLESLSFLAVILGTVSGGVLSYVFPGQEYYIGAILVALALIGGAAASFLIQKMPAANPTRPFPKNLFKPLVDNLRVMLRSKPLALAVLGIAFFTFMVAFMRGTMYMHGETRNPRWTELHTSIVVGVVALGVGLGSPLAGFLSGGKVELGLVPIGAVGMIVALVGAGLFLNMEAVLVVCLIAIGFFTGFYIVPLFTLLQHRAPKASKGDLLASSNFINVVGAIAASLLFKVLVLGAHATGVAPAVEVRVVARGTLAELEYEHGRPWRLKVVDNVVPGRPVYLKTNRQEAGQGEDELVDQVIIEQSGNPQPGEPVVVARYNLEREGHKVVYYLVQTDNSGLSRDVLPAKYPKEPPADEPALARLAQMVSLEKPKYVAPVYNNEGLTKYLFFGAALMTLGILILLCRQMPDFFVRTLLWLRLRRLYRLQVIGLHHLPTEGPVILATNCSGFEDCLNVVAATDRFTRFILLENGRDGEVGPLLSYLARRTGLLPLSSMAPPEMWTKALEKGARALKVGNMVGLTAEGHEPTEEVERILDRLRKEREATLVPVYCSAPESLSVSRGKPGLRVIIGAPLPSGASISMIQHAIRELNQVAPSEEEAAGPSLMH